MIKPSVANIKAPKVKNKSDLSLNPITIKKDDIKNIAIEIIQSITIYSNNIYINVLFLLKKEKKGVSDGLAFKPIH